MSEYQIPRLLWEVFEAKLIAQSRQFIKDAAKILEVDEKILQRRVLPTNDKIKVYLHDTQTDTLQCPILIHTGVILQRCRAPVALGHTVCPFHRANPQQLNSIGLPVVTKLAFDSSSVQSNGDTNLWVTSDNSVVNISGIPIGIYNPDTGVLQKFIVDK
jgi:hypothetical protein